GGPARIDPYVATYSPTQQSQPLMERCEASLEYRIACGCGQEHADPPHAPVLLGSRYERPRRRRAAEQRDELAPPHHSITSSARAGRVGGIWGPSAFAVLRLMKTPKRDACTTERSAGCSPLSIRPA